MKYIGQFQTVNDSRYTVSLITNGDDSSTTNVVLGDSPVIIEYVNDDNIYSPAKYSTATIKLITNDYLPDLYSGSAQGVKVSVEGLYKWNGYLTPNIYSQAYDASIEELELEAIDGLSTLQYFKYKPISGLKDIISFTDLIIHLLKKCNCYTSFFIPKVMQINNDCITNQLYISEQNFFDEDDQPMTYQEVLEEVCKYLNVTVMAAGDAVYFLDYDYIKTELNQIYYGIDIYTDHRWETSGYSERYITNTLADTTISLDTVFNKVILKDSLYSFDSIIPSIWDEDKLINYGGMWNFTNEIQVVDEDGKGGKHKCFFKYYYNPNYKSYYYHKNTLSPALGIRTIDYGATKEFVGATICKAYFKKIEEDDDIINNISYNDYLLLHTHNTNTTYAGYQDSAGGLAIVDIDINNDVGLPLFELQVNNSNPAFIGGENTHILIQGNFIYMDRKEEMYIMQGYGNKDDNYNANNLWIKAQLKYGNKYWNGSNWQSSSCCFKLPFYNNGQKEHHINQSFPIKNTVSWEMGIEEDGYLIPLPEDCVLDNKPTFILYQPHRIDEDYRCDAVWLENFDIKAVIAHPNKDLDTLDDSDTEYSNVINTEYVEEMQVDDFKICTWDNKKPNYSAVCYKDGSGNYQFLDTIYHSSLRQQLRLEEMMIYRLVNQYSTPSIKLKVSTKYYDVVGYMNIRYICPIIDESTLFIINSAIYDLRYETTEITLVQKK